MRADPWRRWPALLGLLGALVACSPATDAPPAAGPTDPPPATEIVPTPEALPDGIVAAVDGGLAGGLLYIVWNGTKERIAQPAPFDDAAVDELGLRIEPEISRLKALPQPDPRTFWAVYPPDGEQARLHLAVADRLYPVTTVEAAAWEVERLPDAQESLLNRMRPAR
jgi:hypothetical protein